MCLISYDLQILQFNQYRNNNISMEKMNLSTGLRYRQLLLLLACCMRSFAQDSSSAGPLHLSMTEALQMARQQNKWIHIAQTEEAATRADQQDVRNALYPTVNFNASYQRFSNVELFDNGLSDGHAVPRRPNQNSTAEGFETAMTLFAGNRQHLNEKDARIKSNIAALNTLDQTGVVSLQVVATYLNLLRLNQQDSVIREQIHRAEQRLKNIQTLYDYGKVTRSDLLRAQLLLENQKISREQNENDVTIAMQQLDVLLNLPQTTRFLLTDSAGGNNQAQSSLTALVDKAGSDAYAVRKAQEGVALAANRVQGVKAGYLPVVQAYGAYGLNYPNYLGFPPINQFYLLGFIGVKMQYNISSFYQHKHKTEAAKMRLTEVTTQANAVKDNVAREASAAYIKYGEALDRIRVAEQSIEQARVNYKIVSAKYFNQLALLTDLLDADNLLLESRFNLIRSQTDALAFYYRLQYISGKL